MRGLFGGTSPRRLRDLLLLEAGDACLVIACDSAGGVGPSPADALWAPGRLVGLFTARVALMETVAAGATPLACSLVVAGPPSLGDEVRRGVLAEMGLVGLDEGALVMSTEKNFATSQTAVGVTVLGQGPRGGLLPGGAKPGDLLLVIGWPKVGGEVREGDPETADLTTVMELVKTGVVHDLLPVGSRGIRAESQDLAGSAGLTAVLDAGLCPRLDLDKSAGPATALLVAAPEAALTEVSRASLGRPCHRLGVLR